ncbi:hypothetical protein FRC14_001378, partial [Serendipita sp. 396]
MRAPLTIMNPSQQMKLFRKPQKPITPRSPGTMDVGNGPGNGNSGGIAGVLSRAGGDLSSRIEPYTFPSSSPPPALQQHHHQSSRSGSNPLQQTSSHDTLGTVTGPGVVAAAVSGPRADPLMSSTRRNSLRARPSEDERWVMVDDSTMESRSSSIASLIPAGAAAPYNSPGFTQTTTVVPSSTTPNPLPTSPIPRAQQPSSAPAMPNKRLPNSTTPRPEQQQQQPLPQSQPQPQPQPQSQQPPSQGYANGQSHLADPDSGSIHSQHKDGWARNLFGGTGGGKEREKEANVELVRMIGFLTAAAPDDWNMVLEVCDRASASESAAKEAARALRREFKYGEPSAQLSAARLWAIMLQNASETFILQTSSRKFLENLEDVINAETTSPVVRERLLDVLASAAYKFGKMPGKEGFAAIWRKVRPSWKPAEGLPFDSLEGLFDSAFPRRLGPAQPPGQSVEPRERREDRDRAKKERDRDKHLLQQQRQLDGHGYRTHATPPVPTRRDRGIIPPDEDIRRLFQECEVAKTNAQLLSNCLTFASPSTFSADPVIQEFYGKCRASQELIVAQIPWASAGAERSRIAAANRRQAKESGSDGTGSGKLSKKQPPAAAGGEPTISDLTKEEKLLAALLAANQELVEVFGIYEQLEKLAVSELEDREITVRSIKETKIDRSKIHLEAPSTQGASSSSRSPSPAITASPALPPSRTAPGTPILPSVQGHPIPTKTGSRDLPLPPPHLSVDHLSGVGIIPPSVSTPTAYNQHPGQTPLTPLHLPPQSASLQAPSPIQLQQMHDLTAQPVHPRAPQQPQPQPQTQTQPHHAHHASNHSVSGGYGNATLNLPPGAPHGPRSLPITRSRTPSPDRSGTYSTGSTPPVASTPINGSDYGPPSHPPPPQLSHATNNNNSNNMRSAGKRYDSASRGRTESPVPISIGITPPPGLSGVATSAGVAMHNTAGMRIDMDAARRYESSDEEGLLTPIKPSEKALGKRRAVADAPVDEEELGRREQAELEEAYIRSTVPPGAEPDSPTRPVQYVYDAAAERALELDAMEKEQER